MPSEDPDDGGLCSAWVLPDDALPQAEIRVIQFVTSEGRSEYMVRHAGMSPLSTFLGLLDLARFAVHEAWMADDEGGAA